MYIVVYSSSSSSSSSSSFYFKLHIIVIYIYIGLDYICNELGGNMARFTQFPIMITRSTIIYKIISPGAAGSSIYV